jgi:hypothetical protein
MNKRQATAMATEINDYVQGRLANLSVADRYEVLRELDTQIGAAVMDIEDEAEEVVPIGKNRPGMRKRRAD